MITGCLFLSWSSRHAFSEVQMCIFEVQKLYFKQLRSANFLTKVYIWFVIHVLRCSSLSVLVVLCFWCFIYLFVSLRNLSIGSLKKQFRNEQAHISSFRSFLSFPFQSMDISEQFKEILRIQKFRRVAGYTCFYCFATLISYTFTNNT